MARKLEKSKKKEGYRRSPRISALDAWKAHQTRRVGLTCAVEMECDSGNGNNPQGPASRTRSRKMRKLRPVHEVASTSASPPPKLQGSGKPRYEEHQVNSDQGVGEDKENEKQDSRSTVASKPRLPEKRVLELILDILQRRDTHEIFAEPVDPDEVEDYYEIIKEPMDFGTMRAKLHEGMYKNLEQFEHDVFLITKNAMHFNSSATIYFRQARSINELAVKVFHILKTHPQSFELEYLKSRRRNGRMPQGESGYPLHKTCPKIARNVKSNSILIDEPSKSMPCSVSASLNMRRHIPVTEGCSDITTRLDARDYEGPCGAVDDKTRFFESDRRCAYKPWTSFLGENESIISRIPSKRKQLEHVIQQDIGYRESLMLFVKDLGPVVQMIAEQKLLGWFPLQKSQFLMTSNNCHCDCGPHTLDPVITAPISQNILDHVHRHPTVTENTRERMELEVADKRGKACLGGRMSTFDDSTIAAESGCERKIEHGLTWGKVQERSDTTIPSVHYSDKIYPNQGIDAQLCSHSFLAQAGDINSSFSGFRNAGNNSTTMMDQAELEIKAQQLKPAFEHSHSDLSELKLKNMDMLGFSHSESSRIKLSSEYLGEGDQGKAAQEPNYVVSSSYEAGRAMTIDQFKPLMSSFIFDLPFLRARLGQTNSLGRNTFMQQGSGT